MSTSPLVLRESLKQRISTLEEVLALIIACAIVSAVYLPSHYFLGKSREAQYLSVRARFLDGFLETADKKMLGYGARPSSGSFRVADWISPADAESQMRAFRKALRDAGEWTSGSDIWRDPNVMADPSSLDAELAPAILSRFFGPEQWISYCLTLWSLLLLREAGGRVRADKPGATAIVDTNLSMVRFSIWAIPTLGFIGTVRGMGSALAAADSPDRIPEIVGYLGVAFDTTLVGLLLSVLLMLARHRFERVESEVAE